MRLLLFFTMAMMIAPHPLLAYDAGDVRAAQRLVTAHQERILFAAHPTATFKSSEFDGIKKTSSGGFRLTYTFHWMSAFDNKEWTRLGFLFDSDGKFQDLETRGRSNFLPPFAAASLILSFFKEFAKEHPDLEKNPLFRTYLKNEDARGLLIVYLRYLQK